MTTADPMRRVVRLHLIIFLVTLLVGFVLVTATQVQVALDILDQGRADLYVVLSVLIPLAHLYQVVLARKRRVREVTHWTWLLVPLHLLWGSGLLVGIPEAVPIGFGLIMLDLLSVTWSTHAEPEA